MYANCMQILTRCNLNCGRKSGNNLLGRAWGRGEALPPAEGAMGVFDCPLYDTLSMKNMSAGKVNNKMLILVYFDADGA